MTTNSQHFPLDFDALEKGSVVPPEQIERIAQVKRDKDPQKFAFAAMGLRDQIERERPDLVARIDGGSIRVLHDAEAERWTFEQTTIAVKRIGRNAARRARIVRDKFDNEQMRLAESRDRAVTALALFTRKEIRRAQREQLLISTGSVVVAEEEEVDE